VAVPGTCHFQFDPIGKQTFSSACDIAQSALAGAGIPYEIGGQAPSSPVTAPGETYLQVGATRLALLDGSGLSATELKAAKAAWNERLSEGLKAAGYPQKADPDRMNKPLVVSLLWLLVLYVTMVYGPIAAALVEMFPARIRYTSMSLPYHLGNGWLGGFLPTTAFAMVAATGNIYFGLWYPVVVAALTAVVGLLFVKEMRGATIEA
jgi:hypothetical protein